MDNSAEVEGINNARGFGSITNVAGHDATTTVNTLNEFDVSGADNIVMGVNDGIISIIDVSSNVEASGIGGTVSAVNMFYISNDADVDFTATNDIGGIGATVFGTNSISGFNFAGDGRS